MSTDAIQPEARPVQEASLTRNQIRGFWASWGGWALDGMDSFIYALVLVPSLRDLLPRSGIAATKGNIGYYGALLFALFLLGWGLTFVAEEWPENWRSRGAGYMHTGYYVGFLLAALANLTIGSHFGWRQMFLFGGLPALLLAWIRYGVAEPARWRQKEKAIQTWSWWRPLATLFNSTWRCRTILNSLFMLVSICGLWAGTVYVPTAVTALAEASGRHAP